MRYLFISDIHGQYSALAALLKKLEPASDDILIFLGDYVDRGPDSRKVIDLLLELKNDPDMHTYFLMGNHESMMIEALQHPEAEDAVSLWLHNGGRETLLSYMQKGHSLPYEEAASLFKNEYPGHYQFIQQLSIYHETDDHIAVHAGIDPDRDDWKDTSTHDYLWIREAFHYSDILNTNGKKVIFGHTPTLRFHEDAGIWFQSDKIGIDGGAGFKKQLNALIYEDGAYQTMFEKIK
ncbi:serine/threonine protein phosphatase 1 [Sinobaca qinghaiensis]|uniref:Serine/threonine protein phosphatase 1 n=1 Tax=Sinobaca qinghaiensis TaxID=342944 RepID=A0A419UX83_9BACL|nr:metallophosphoesterase family protein [Sinobaca qinghaiensis]RKD69748.1 serine/threonine protein phosphatase 1 [Sinobaca qinghaiensis]